MDEVDKKIVAQLQQDGRKTLQELAEATGFTSMGTKKRLEKLQENGTIKISALINPEVLKIRAALVMLEMESAEAMEKLLSLWKDCPRVVHMFKTVGGYNLTAIVIAENQETLESTSMSKCSLRCSQGVRRSEYYPISEICYSPYLQIRQDLAHKDRTFTPCKVQCDTCDRFEIKKCVGCPTTKNYKGQL